MSPAVWAGLLLALGALLETRVFPRWRPDPWFRLTVPLPDGPPPLPAVPTGRGRTPSVRWEAVTAEEVRFWADPADRAAPAGLHGMVGLRPGGRGVELRVRWAPPLSMALAPIWLAVLATSRGEGPLLGTVSAVFLVLGAGWYARAARRAATELRASLRDACGPVEGGV